MQKSNQSKPKAPLSSDEDDSEEDDYVDDLELEKKGIYLPL